MTISERTCPHWFDGLSVSEVKHHIRAIAKFESEPGALEIAIGKPETFVPVSRIDRSGRASSIELRFKVSECGREFLDQLLAVLVESETDHRVRRSQKKRMLSQVIPRYSVEDIYAYKKIEGLLQFYVEEIASENKSVLAVGYGYGALPKQVPGRFSSQDFIYGMGYRLGKTFGSILGVARNVI